MKKNLLSALFVLLLSYVVNAQNYIVENYLGINCLAHNVVQGESFYQVAQRYFVRPSTLALVNNIENTDIELSGQKLYVPLTETNFYKTTGLESSVFTFEPVFYKVMNETSASEIANVFFITDKDINQWNKRMASPSSGDKVIVGWLKIEKDLTKAVAPSFVAKEKIIYGNTEERAEAKEELVTKKSKTTTENQFPDYSLPEKIVPNIENEKKQIVAEKISKIENIELQKQVDPITRKDLIVSGKAKLITEKKSINKTKVTELRPKLEEEKPEQITKAEKRFLAKKKVEPKKKKVGSLWSKVKKLTKNSYARDKEKVSVNKKIQKPGNILSKKTVKTKKPEVVKKTEVEVIPKVNSEVKVSKVVKPIKKEAVKTVIDKTYKKEVVKTPTEKKEDPLYVQNKLMKLTLLKSLKGRVSFFYSGTAGAKFYVFTNLAGKGGIIKLTNLNNKKYILAQVIGPLPEVDRKRGYVVKLSDNSRRVLNVNSKSFSAKVNY